MNTRQLNLLNIGLMLISTVVAFILPFELFLFSYAVLGPLHYLTEISWLHKRNYFVEGKYDFLWLILLGLLGTFGYFEVEGFSKWSMIAPYAALLSALGFYLIKNTYLKVLAVFMIIVSAALFQQSTFYLVFFIIFLPTLTHVFFFTGTFMLYGAVKSKSSTGKWSLLVFIACAVSFFIYVPDFSHYRANDYIRGAYTDFSALNYYFIKVFQLDKLAAFDSKAMTTIFNSNTGFMVMRFIAFAYTYHYLNWFSKTSIIKWHQVEKKYLVITIVIWLTAVGIYRYDYQTGLKFLFFLSFLHVFLEFPLNCKTIIDLGKEVKNIRFVRN
jgi:hypothetical protein